MPITAQVWLPSTATLDQALAFHHLPDIETSRLFDTDTSATARLQRNLRSVPSLKQQACADTAEAVRGR